MGAFRTRPNAVPVGYELVTRMAPIRLGPDLRIHNVTVHCSLGIVSVGVDDDGDLIITQDWSEGEMVGYAKTSTDYQLVARDVYAGCSGGASIVKVGIVRRATNGSLLPIRADSPWFGPYDNLWFESSSLRPKTTILARARRRMSRKPAPTEFPKELL